MSHGDWLGLAMQYTTTDIKHTICGGKECPDTFLRIFPPARDQNLRYMKTKGRTK